MKISWWSNVRDCLLLCCLSRATLLVNELNSTNRLESWILYSLNTPFGGYINITLPSDLYFLFTEYEFTEENSMNYAQSLLFHFFL